MIFCPSLRNKCVPEHLRNHRIIIVANTESLGFCCIQENQPKFHSRSLQKELNYDFQAHKL
ncbi:hypothetical protein NC652_028508 [Populus alba x Populus x berolinensis]|uniref:Uncharacterized protein n=1 Tax=Populus alba x Populus x berolinensis TaxID=444605 RepID=A0AAD6M7M0_9ROSI|nr:hypothetical protein NC652_028508 [Populus alba x Populus x berolinensis]KAJ6980404.1 hypothetical protein NC653_028270 [Populus alba x Populus x berolinensis]